MNPTDIVGYTYAADTYCPDCIADAFRPDDGVERTYADTEAVLDDAARDRGIDRQDERSYDSDDFPKVIFADGVQEPSDGDRCGACGEPIGWEEVDVDSSELPAYLAYLDHNGRVYGDDVEAFKDAYCGEYASEQDYAQNLADDLGLLSSEYSWPLSYIDWERATRDLFMYGYYSVEASNGMVYVFRNYCLLFRAGPC